MSAPVPSASALLTHRIDGDGAPVVLLNGGLMSIGAWESVARALAGEWRVVRCDLRGQLLSPGPPPPSLDGHVADVVALLDALGLAAVHLVGTSFGALVGLRLAAQHPAHVRSLVAITATDRISGTDWLAGREVRAAAEAAAKGGDGGRVFELLLPGTFSPEYREAQRAVLDERRRQIAALPARWYHDLVGLLSSLRGLDLRPDLAGIRCPVLVVAGERDVTFPVERSRALAAAIRNARLEVVPRSGHALVVEAEDPLIALVSAFLRGARNEGERP